MKCAFIAIIGIPNAGKSSLTNALVGSKVAIVTHKVQTTRSLLRGIVMEGDTQLILTDTPGIFKPKRKLDEVMVNNAWGGAKDADRLALLIDAQKGLSEDNLALIELLKTKGGIKDLILTKIDLVAPPKLLDLSQRINEMLRFEKTFMVSSETNSGIDSLKKEWAKLAPEGPWHYPDDEYSDIHMRDLAAEITREKLFLRVHEEIPYQSNVVTEKYEEKTDGSVRIEQNIIISRESLKKIVIGKNGETIKAISTAARQEMIAVFEQPVHLFLFVKVQEKWDDDERRLRAMGFKAMKY